MSLLTASALLVGCMGAVLPVHRNVLVDRITRPNPSAIRSAGIGELRSLDAPSQAEVVRLLLGQLEHTDPRVRRNAAFALGAVDANATPVVAALQNMASTEADSETSHVARVALARLGVDADPTIQELAAELQVPSATLAVRVQRFQAANSLGFIASGRQRVRIDAAIPMLIVALADADDGVRGRAAIALGAAGVDSAPVIAALKERAWSDPDRNVRYLSAAALRQIGTPAARKALDGWSLGN